MQMAAQTKWSGSVYGCCGLRRGIFLAALSQTLTQTRYAIGCVLLWPPQVLCAHSWEGLVFSLRALHRVREL